MTGNMSMVAAALSRGDGASDRGKWWISGDQLCQRWTSWMDGKSYCYKLTPILELMADGQNIAVLIGYDSKDRRGVLL